MSETAYMYNVEYIGEYFTMSTTVMIAEEDSDAAIDAADKLLHYQYSWTVKPFATVQVSAEMVCEVYA